MKNIVEQSIAAPPSSYEAYLYRFTNLLDGKMYVGIHKGSVDDSYNHSSTNEDFAKVFSNPKSQLKFEVLQYGDYMTMQNAEHKILKKDNARKNPMYYNKSNGFPQFPEVNIELCEIIDKQIEEREFPVIFEDLKIHEHMLFLQVRFEDDSDLQKVIRDKIDDAYGNTDGCNPILVWESRGLNGEDLRGDGNHTVWGALQSKHAVDIPVMRIPYEVHCKLTDEDLRFIGNLRNKRKEIIKKSMTVKDAIKYITDLASKKVPVYAQSNVEALSKLGFTNRQIKNILNKSDHIVKTEKEQLSSGRLFINWSASPYKRIMEKRVELHDRHDLGQCSVYSSSGALAVDRIMSHMYKTRTRKCIVIIHHPSVAHAKVWKTMTQPEWIQKFEWAKINCEFVEMDMWTDDISIKEIENAA
jgi:hypothetical protein